MHALLRLALRAAGVSVGTAALFWSGRVGRRSRRPATSHPFDDLDILEYSRPGRIGTPLAKPQAAREKRIT